MPVNEKMVRKGTKFFCNNLITNTLSLRQPIAKGLVEAVVGSDNAADFSASVANRGVGALQLGAGGEEGLVVEEFVVHQGWYFLATVAHEGLSLQEGHVLSIRLAVLSGRVSNSRSARATMWRASRWGLWQAERASNNRNPMRACRFISAKISKVAEILLLSTLGLPKLAERFRRQLGQFPSVAPNAAEETLQLHPLHEQVGIHLLA